MRNRIVHMQQIEFVKLRNLSHARRQRQIVWRIFKQRITRDLDLMIVSVGFRSGQANGLRIGNEMNLMAAASQFQSQFGGHNSAAAVGRITGDANLHATPTITLLDSREGLGMQEEQAFYAGTTLAPTAERFRRRAAN